MQIKNPGGWGLAGWRRLDELFNNNNNNNLFVVGSCVCVKDFSLFLFRLLTAVSHFCPEAKGDWVKKRWTLLFAGERERDTDKNKTKRHDGDDGPARPGPALKQGGGENWRIFSFFGLQRKW